MERCESVKLFERKTVPSAEECLCLACLKSIVSRVKLIVSELKLNFRDLKQVSVFIFCPMDF